MLQDNVSVSHKYALQSVLVFSPESVSYERSRRETAAKFNLIPARVFFVKIPRSQYSMRYTILRLLEWLVFQYFQDHQLSKLFVSQYFQVLRLSKLFVFQYFEIINMDRFPVFPGSQVINMDRFMFQFFFQYFQVPRSSKWFVFQYFQDPRLSIQESKSNENRWRCFKPHLKTKYGAGSEQYVFNLVDPVTGLTIL